MLGAGRQGCAQEEAPRSFPPETASHSYPLGLTNHPGPLCSFPQVSRVGAARVECGRRPRLMPDARVGREGAESPYPP